MNDMTDYECVAYLKPTGDSSVSEISKILLKNIKDKVKIGDIVDYSSNYFNDLLKEGKVDPENFNFWPYYYVFFPKKEKNEFNFELYFNSLVKIAIEFRLAGIKCVYVCDFEEEINQAIAKEEYARLTNS